MRDTPVRITRRNSILRHLVRGTEPPDQEAKDAADMAELLVRIDAKYEQHDGEHDGKGGA